MVWPGTPPAKHTHAVLLPGQPASTLTASCRRARQGARQVEVWLRQRREEVGAWSRRTWFFLVLTFAKVGAPADAVRAFDGMRAAGSWQPTDCETANVVLDALHGDLESAVSR